MGDGVTGRWIWSPKLDLAVFLGPTVLGLLLAGGSYLLRIPEDGKLPEWGWIVFVLFVDVAHVWATVFRTYFDQEELRRRPWLYSLTPLCCWLVGVAVHSISSLMFWRVLAYIAVFHFIRQQAGWVAIYRAKNGQRNTWDRLVDDAAVYLSTAVPILIWHTKLPRPFYWFIQGDFIPLETLSTLVPWAEGAMVMSWVVFAARHLWLAKQDKPAPWGKLIVVATTAVSWWVAIVLAQDDFSFTVLNVLPHGVPYFALLWVYAQERRKTAPEVVGSRIVALGLGAFLGSLLMLALFEELLWDRLIWYDRPWLFGWLPAIEGDPNAPWRAWVVPLLALPQSTHYLLDAFIWRRGATGREQGRALGLHRAKTSLSELFLVKGFTWVVVVEARGEPHHVERHCLGRISRRIVGQ
ncbi:MAG: hypothetical protein U0165_15735 [Polyangiaceae bacterium]